MFVSMSKVVQKIKWEGKKPECCDFCDQKLDTSFVDGKVPPNGPWGIMCFLCHMDAGSRLGPGWGQRYSLETLELIDGQ